MVQESYPRNVVSKVRQSESTLEHGDASMRLEAIEELIACIEESKSNMPQLRAIEIKDWEQAHADASAAASKLEEIAAVAASASSTRNPFDLCTEMCQAWQLKLPHATLFFREVKIDMINHDT